MLETNIKNGVCTLELARSSSGNALSAELTELLLDAVQIARSEDIHTLVIHAQGRSFCTGFDLSDLESQTDGDLLQRFVRVEMLLTALWHAPFRTVAVAQGRVWGAGADLFASCDVRAAHPDASFCFPGAGFGLVLGTRRLAERIGSDQARRCTTTGLMLNAANAAKLGLVTDLIEGAEALDSFVSHLPAMVDRETVAQLHKTTRADLSSQDLAALVRSAASPGLKHRIQAYRSKQLTQRKG